jgi:predicted RNase H-like HicB family nuclease
MGPKDQERRICPAIYDSASKPRQRLEPLLQQALRGARIGARNGPNLNCGFKSSIFFRMTTYRVTLIEHQDGVSVSCPALKGCHSQGRTREEALKNIREAIQEWLAAEAEEAKLFRVSEAEVMV